MRLKNKENRRRGGKPKMENQQFQGTIRLNKLECSHEDAWTKQLGRVRVRPTLVHFIKLNRSSCPDECSSRICQKKSHCQ